MTINNHNVNYWKSFSNMCRHKHGNLACNENGRMDEWAWVGRCLAIWSETMKLCTKVRD